MPTKDEMIEIGKKKSKELKQYIVEKPKNAVIAGVVFLFFIMILFLLFGGDDAENMGETFAAKKGPLRISVTESGTIQARESIIIKSKVEGNTTIIYIVDEGTDVKKGDLLVELDSSSLLDQEIDQEIRVQNADASFISARESFAVTENQAQSDIDNAQLTYDFAVQDLEKYKKGEYPKQLQEAEAKITLSEEEYTRAKDKLEWSTKLYSEKYLSQIELQADELAEKQKKLNLSLAENDLELLKNYTHKRQLVQLESDVKQAKMALERTTRKAKSDVVQAEASLKAKEAEFNRQKDRLEKIKLQIENTKIYAPADGLVLYATSSDRGPMRGMSEPLDEGSSVRERQELIHLPTTSGFNAEIGIYEASLDKIRLGLPVVLTIDALPGERFIGTVSNIAPVPDAMSSFMNPDLSIYDTVIEINNSENVTLLKSGMSCKAEVIIEQHEDAVYVPVQAVIRVDNKPTVFLAKGNKLRPRPVKIGMDNGRMIHILEGLEEGEEVTLTPPLVQASISENIEEIIDDITIPSSEASPNQSLPGERSSRQGNGMNNMQMPGSKDDMIKMMDKDGDGKISKDETPFPEEAFSQMDVNGDGFIDKSEIPDFPAGGMNQGPPSKDNMIKMMDKDGDGKISEDEAPFPGDAFSQMDANGDGFIDKSEIPDFSQMRGGQGGFGGGQGGFGGGQGGGMPGGGFGFPGGGGR